MTDLINQVEGTPVAVKPPAELTIEDFAGRVGERLGESAWHEITQERISCFADATDDHQWIHVDPTRAAKGPFGTTIAHGYLTLSLIPMLLWEMLEVCGTSMTINYGLGRVRFPAPVPVGSRVRGVAECLSWEEIAGGAQVTLKLTIEVEDRPKPACVAEIIFRYYR